MLVSFILCFSFFFCEVLSEQQKSYTYTPARSARMIRTKRTHDTHAWYARMLCTKRTHDTHACYARNARMIRTHDTHACYARNAHMIRTKRTHGTHASTQKTHAWYVKQAEDFWRTDLICSNKSIIKISKLLSQLFMTDQDQSTANQPNNLAEGHPYCNHCNCIHTPARDAHVAHGSVRGCVQFHELHAPIGQTGGLPWWLACC